MAWPRIVAEALRGLPQAPLIPPSTARAGTVAEALLAIAAAQRPARSTAPPPPFLRPTQIDAWRRAMAAIDAWNGALLVEPVGSGKTWIALGVAAQQQRTAVVVLPAIVRQQWERAATAAGVRLHCWTHEQVSRGRLPTLSPSLVIIDEAHRLRNPATRRVKAIAPWLAGRRTLLLTATPIVNRIADLITLLHLALPDDALRLDGLSSLQNLAEYDAAPPSLRRVAIRSGTPRETAVPRHMMTLATSEAEATRAATAVTSIDSLTLSAAPGVRRLLASVLLDAAASSEAAFRATLGRYRALLLQARDAGGGTRTLLRRFAGESLDQLVMWDLVSSVEPIDDLPLEDIARIERLLQQRELADQWIGELLERCDDSRPTVCFARHRATALALRLAAGDGVAWVTGSTAGIGPHRMPRDMVLAAFGPGRASWRARRHPPTLLIATDVAAEGLDLQAAGRIVHVDLPWTATRLEQREGRLLRIGQEHADVEVIVRSPADPIEAALRISRHLRHKATMSERWLAALERDDQAIGAATGMLVTVLAAPATAGRDLVAVELHEGERRGVLLLEQADGSEWQRTDRIPGIAPKLMLAVTPRSGSPPRFDSLLDSATRAALAIASGKSAAPPPAVITHIHALARQAARHRSPVALAHLDRLLRFAASSHTLGERMLLEQLTQLDDAHWLTLLVPERSLPRAVTARPIAALLFRSGVSPLR